MSALHTADPPSGIVRHGEGPVSAVATADLPLSDIIVMEKAA